jgi:hypothetical protein
MNWPLVASNSPTDSFGMTVPLGSATVTVPVFAARDPLELVVNCAV